jgi:hypothetical protein
VPISPWTILFGCFAPSAGLLAVIFTWRCRVDRRKERLPFGENKLLRPPGESLRKRIEQLDGKLNEAMLLALVTPFAFAVVMLTFPKVSWSFCAMLLLLGTGAFVLLAIHFIRVVNERRRCCLGFHGERAVAEELNQLTLDGCHVFHDVPLEQCGNVDHVIVGPSGVYAVETKTRRKRKDPTGEQRDYEITYDGKALHYPNGSDSRAIEQTRRQANRLRIFLTNAVGEPVRVTAILTIPGWMILNRARTDIKVLNPKLIRQAVISNGASHLSAQFIQRIAHQLQLKCRDVAL